MDLVDMKVEDSQKRDIILDLLREIDRAIAQHGAYHSHHEAHSVIQEEFDEYWELVKLNPKKPMVHPSKGGSLTPEQRIEGMRQELLQTAATCIRAIYDLC